MLRYFFGKKTNPAVRTLYDKVVAQARTPVFYQSFGVPDTLDGRFDMIVLHLTPLVDQLRDERGAITEDGQALFDTFVEDMEQNLRTIGVGDTSVPKKMRAIGEAFYGRFNAYRSAFGDAEALQEAVARNVVGEATRVGTPEVAGLASYVEAIRASAADADLLRDYAFPDPRAFTPGVAPAEASR